MAILLLGPTGSGKTPLGDFLEDEGFQGRRCVHFDFGASLRSVAARTSRPSFLSAADFGTVKRVLESGALLEEGDFHIAAGIMADFIKRRRVRRDDVVVLNGLPRHEGQAGAIGQVVDIRLVVYLRCTAGVVMARIGGNSGGDRAGRVDDSVSFVKKKLQIFRARTLPLLDHYRRKGVKVATVNVREDSTPRVMKELLAGLNVFSVEC